MLHSGAVPAALLFLMILHLSLIFKSNIFGHIPVAGLWTLTGTAAGTWPAIQKSVALAHHHPSFQHCHIHRLLYNSSYNASQRDAQFLKFI